MYGRLKLLNKQQMSEFKKKVTSKGKDWWHLKQMDKVIKQLKNRADIIDVFRVTG